MRKVIIITAISLLGITILVVTQVIMPRILDASLRVAVLSTPSYHTSYDGRTIRTALRRHRRGQDGERFAYRFVELMVIPAEVERVVHQLIADGEEVILALDEQLAEPLTNIAARFPAQRFYVTCPPPPPASLPRHRLVRRRPTSTRSVWN